MKTDITLVEIRQDNDIHNPELELLIQQGVLLGLMEAGYIGRMQLRYGEEELLNRRRKERVTASAG